jgi:hypothetical protein
MVDKTLYRKLDWVRWIPLQPGRRTQALRYTYEFWLSLCKIVRSSVILLLPLFAQSLWITPNLSVYLAYIFTTMLWHFYRNGGLNQILKRQTSRVHYGSKVPAVTITVFITILEIWRFRQYRWLSGDYNRTFLCHIPRLTTWQ